jgi:hypothetical protein
MGITPQAPQVHCVSGTAGLLWPRPRVACLPWTGSLPGVSFQFFLRPHVGCLHECNHLRPDFRQLRYLVTNPRWIGYPKIMPCAESTIQYNTESAAWRRYRLDQLLV